MNARNQMFTDLRTALLGHAPLAAIVGERIFRGLPPQGARKPYILLHHIGGQEISAHDSVEEDGDEHQTELQCDCIATVPAAADELASTLRAALLAARATVPATGGTFFLGFKFESPFADAGGSAGSTAQGAETVARCVQNITINHAQNHG